MEGNPQGQSLEGRSMSKYKGPRQGRAIDLVPSLGLCRPSLVVFGLAASLVISTWGRGGKETAPSQGPVQGLVVVIYK
jgi:hypothetical protein